MALSEDLPLYRDSYRLLNRLLPFTQGFPRFFRYGMGSRMVELNLDMLSLIYQANSSYDKVPVLIEFLDKYRMLQMLFRVCVEQRVMNERQYAGFALLLEKIGKQATAWKQYNEKGQMKNERKRQE
ncbi:four helix bundle protein [Bacteroides rodentium]